MFTCIYKIPLLTSTNTRYTEEEYFDEFGSSSRYRANSFLNLSLTGQRLAPTQHHTCHVSEICFCSSDDSEDDGDDEWRKTPMGKRIKNARQSLAVIISSEKSKSFVIIEYYFEFVALFLKSFSQILNVLSLRWLGTKGRGSPPSKRRRRKTRTEKVANP